MGKILVFIITLIVADNVFIQGENIDVKGPEKIHLPSTASFTIIILCLRFVMDILW
jgi:hypothetical protein